MTDPRPQILLIDDMPVNLLMLGTALAQDFDLQTATSGAMGLALAALSPPDLILLDVMMPDMDGFETCQRLKADPQLKAIPVIFVTALNDLDAEIKGLALGAADYIAKPVNVDTARHRILNLVEREQLRKKVDAQRCLLEAKVTELHQVHSALRASDAYKDVILNSLIAEIAVVDRNGIIQAVNEPWRRFAFENRAAPNEPVHHIEVGANYFAVFETTDFTSPDIADAFNGIKGVINGTLPHFTMEYPCHSPTQQRWFSMNVSPLGQSVIVGAVIAHINVTERKQMEDHVRQLAFYDPLTQLPNRRLLDDRLSQTLAASKRSGCYGALMFLDLDNFKPLNDTHGHEVGDLLLMDVAARLKNCIRAMDTVARFGGDEFVVVINELSTDRLASITQSGLLAEKIRLALLAPYVLTIQRADKANITVHHRCTVSIGVAVFMGNEASQSDILKWADAAMYQAKEAGRNGIKFYSDSIESATC